uniref:Uncharacterized protein n=1 Tax=Nelumbo nucifera TaxID=4432 RepID=A0A822YUB0_NELNU|nr:TPA_asm: hypothetical protein HUJ06_006767 [Nelumbo nucifera]
MKLAREREREKPVEEEKRRNTKLERRERCNPAAVREEYSVEEGREG